MNVELSRFLTDVMTAAGLLAHGKQDKGLAKNLSAFVVELRNKDFVIEAENQKLREQRDAANAHIQLLNRIIAGDAE